MEGEARYALKASHVLDSPENTAGRHEGKRPADALQLTLLVLSR